MKKKKHEQEYYYCSQCRCRHMSNSQIGELHIIKKVVL